MKRLFSCLLCFCMLFGACACSNTSADRSPLDTTASSPLETANTEPTPELTTEPTPVPTPLPPVEAGPASDMKIAEAFYDGLAWFQDSNGLFGYLDKRGEVIIPAQYVLAHDFVNGRSVVSYSANGAAHDLIIDTTGKTIIGNMDNGSDYYDYDLYKNEDLPIVEIWTATIRNGQYQRIDHRGFNYLLDDGHLLTKDCFLLISPFTEDGYALVGDGKLPSKLIKSSSGDTHYYNTSNGKEWKKAASSYYFIDTNGKQLGNERFIDAHEFRDGFAPIAKRNSKGQVFWGYLNTDGVICIEPQFEYAGLFSDGLAPVKVNGSLGYIDTTGEMTIQPQFQFARSFVDGVAQICVDDKWGYIATDGRILVEPMWDSINPYVNGRAIVGMKSDDTWEYALIDSNGVELTGQRYMGISYLPEVKLYAAKKDDLWGLLDLNGNEISDFCWGGIWANYSGPYLIAVVKDGLWGYIDTDGNPVRDPEFEKIGPFSEGVAIVWKNGCWFIMREDGTIAF